MSGREEAFGTAAARIGAAAGEGARALDLSGAAFAALDRLPPAIADLGTLETLDLSGTRIAGLEPLAGLTALRDLRLEGTPVSDIAPLEGLAALETLVLRRTRVGSLSPLRALGRLVILDLAETGVTSVAALHRMDRLRFLSLDDTAVADITPLNGTTGLGTLRLRATPVGHSYPLEGLRRLKHLDLARTRTADLTALRSLENLELLDISDTAVVDLGPLMGLPRLSQLLIEGAAVTDLRPLLDLPLNRPDAEIRFARTPAVRTSAELARLAVTGSRESRIRDTLAYLATLPEWPDPLPRDMVAPRREVDAGGAPVIPRLGEIFRDRRLELGRTSEGVEADTGIPAADIVAMETSAPREGADRDGVVRDVSQYARHLGLDADWALDWFRAERRRPRPAAGAAPESAAGPPQVRAPLEVAVECGVLRRASRGTGLDRDAERRAEAGWRALRVWLDDLGGASERLGNAMPRLGAALRRLDTALGPDFAAVDAIAAGIHGSRVARLAAEAPAVLMEADAADLAAFADEMTALLDRFPDWRAYREDAELRPAPRALEEVLPEIREIADAMEDRAEVSPEIVDTLADQIEAVGDDPADAVSRTGLARSLRNVLSVLSDAAVGAAERIRRETGDLAARTWETAKKTMATGLSAAALDIVLAKGAALQALSRTLPEQFGWIEGVLRTVGL